MRSMIGPPKILLSTSGVISKSAIRPALAGLPVVSSTNQGSASIEMRVPTSEMVSAASQP